MRSLCTPLAFLSLALPAAADEVEVLATQTGGFYAGGTFDNSPAFQNYFVGYGTSPGSLRTPERRSFFVFDLPPIAGGIVITSARLDLRLPFGGLVYGKGPGDPEVDVILPDASEAFGLGLLGASTALLLDPALTEPMAEAIFGLMDDTPVAMPTVFMPGDVLPDPGDGGPPIVSIDIDAGGLAVFNVSAGGAIALSGWMPTWSEDLRPSPAPPPAFFEASELIFGFTDVHAMPILTPTLVLTISPVPEPTPVTLLAAGLAMLAWRRQRR